MQADSLPTELSWKPIPGWGRSPREGIGYTLQNSWASLVVQLVKNPTAVWETWVGKIPFWPGEFHGLYSPWGRKESEVTERLSLTQEPEFLHNVWDRRVLHKYLDLIPAIPEV